MGGNSSGEGTDAYSAGDEAITGETNKGNSKTPEMSEPSGEFLRGSIVCE